MNRLIGLPWLGRALYPDVFPDDLAQATREFHTRFYHQMPTDAQIGELLAGLARPRS